MNYLSMFRGNTAIFTTTVTQAGSPVDLTGATIWFTAKKLRTDADNQAVFQLKTPTDIVVSAPATGVAVATVAANLTAGLNKSADTILEYDWQIKDVLGRIWTIEVGQLTIKAKVTESTS